MSIITEIHDITSNLSAQMDQFIAEHEKRIKEIDETSSNDEFRDDHNNTDTNFELSQPTETTSSSNDELRDDIANTNSELSQHTETTSSTEKKSRKPKKINQKTKKRIKFILLTEEKDSYTPEEVDNMTDYELLVHFRRITEQNKLYCNHCKRPKSLDYWVNSIRKRCMKNGLNKKMKSPKTCDHQQAVNSICNTINNPVYSALRDPKFSNRHKQQIMQAKAEFFEKINKDVRPYKY